MLLRLGENHFWLSLADSDVLLWAKGVAYHSGMDVTITEPDVGPLQIQGPKSKEVMTDLFGADILDVPYYYMVERELDGMRLVISRTGYSGELGYELYLRDASRDGVKLWDAVIQAGEPHGLAPIGPCHIRRIEGGILAHGCDMTIEENPYEVGYGYKWMVELEQEQDFIGRDALREVSERGVSRKLVGVELGGSRLGRLQRRLHARLLPGHQGRDTIGKVTSACYSPRLEKNIGYAMVPVEHSSSARSWSSNAPTRRSRRWWPTASSSSPSKRSRSSPPARARQPEARHRHILAGGRPGLPEGHGPRAALALARTTVTCRDPARKACCCRASNGGVSAQALQAPRSGRGPRRPPARNRAPTALLHPWIAVGTGAVSALLLVPHRDSDAARASSDRARTSCLCTGCNGSGRV